MREGADRFITVLYVPGTRYVFIHKHDEKCLESRSIPPSRKAVEPWIASGRGVRQVGHEEGLLFRFLSYGPKERRAGQVGEVNPLSASQTTLLLKQSGVAAEFPLGDGSMHYFRSGGAVSRALTGGDLSTTTQRAFGKNPKTATRYMRLARVAHSERVLCNSISEGWYHPPREVLPPLLSHTINVNI